MATALRFLAGIGLFALGYYLGREVGRLESLREEMRRLREAVNRSDVSISQVSQ